MPTYHFRCPNGHDFDKFERKISDQSKAKCPECGKMAARQISGGMGFHLKGSGFYATDYKPSKSDEKGQKGQEIPKGKDGDAKGGKSESSASPVSPPSSDK